MNIKLQWMGKGEDVGGYDVGPVLVFGFDNAKNLFDGPLSENLETMWVTGKDGDRTAKLARDNNLVITGFGNVAPIDPTFTKWSKGEPENGTHRYVYPLFNDPALPFRAGLTLHAAKGTWSSLPHEFEREEILTPRPMPFREWFAYISEEPGGQGLQLRIGHLFQDNQEWGTSEYISFVNDVVQVRDRDIVEIPLGSHPVTALPGVKIGYFWLYTSAGPVAQVTMGQREKFQGDKAL